MRISSGTDAFVACSIAPDSGVAGSCVSRRIPVFCPSGVAECDEGIPCGAGSVAAFPVVDSGRLHGVLSFCLASGVDLAPHTATLVDDISPVFAAVVRDFRNSEFYARKVAILTILSDFGKGLNKPLPPHELIDFILSFCCDRVGASGIFLRLLPDLPGIPTGLHTRVAVGAEPERGMMALLEEQWYRTVIARGETHLVTDVVAEGAAPSSYIGAPLPFGTGVVGTLTFFGRSAEAAGGGNFDEEDRELFEDMGVMAANALEAASDHARMLELDRQHGLKLKEILLLYRMSSLMLSTIDLDRLTLLVLTTLTAGPSPLFDRAFLFLLNEKAGNVQGMTGVGADSAVDILGPLDEKGELPLLLEVAPEELARSAKTPLAQKVLGTRIPLTDVSAPVSRAVHEKQVIAVTAACDGTGIDAELVETFGMTSYAVAPLVAKERVIGVIVVDNGISGRPLDPDAVRVIELFTNHAGMAIENSLLYKRLQDAHREISETQQQLVQGEKMAALGEMAAGIAHELKSPLISIGGFARRLHRRLHGDSEERKYAETIVREVGRLEKMLADILSFSRKPGLCYVPCDIIQVVDEAFALVSASCRDAGIVIRRNYASMIPRFQADPQQLKQVFLNLFLNALEAMKLGGELAVTVRQTTLSGRPLVVVTVADSGEGIRADILANIFNPFFTTKPNGTGLGLPIVHRIIADHKGKIEVRNRKGSGAEFTVSLPVF